MISERKKRFIHVICTDGERRITLSFPEDNPGKRQHYTASGDLNTAQLIGLLNNTALRGQGGLHGLYSDYMTAYVITHALKVIGMPPQIPDEWAVYFAPKPISEGGIDNLDMGAQIVY